MKNERRLISWSHLEQSLTYTERETRKYRGLEKMRKNTSAGTG